MCLENDPQIQQLIDLAKTEDLGQGDLSTQLLPDGSQPASFRLMLNEPGIVVGRALADTILHHYDESITLAWLDSFSDGFRVETTPFQLAQIHGPIGPLLEAERVLLNFLQRLIGVATLTRRYVDAVAGTHAKILDTRKTTPGWRALEKYAVRCGGGVNHRFGLYDAVLIKDNHLAGIPVARLAGTVFEMLNKLPETGTAPTFVEVEADSMAQVEQLLNVVGIDVILLDNFNIGQLADAVALRNDRGLANHIALEASGGITLRTVRAVAETGVDRISVGALTHSAIAIDLKLERDEC